MRQLLQDAGFTRVESQVDHIFPYRVRDYVRYDYVKTLPFRFLPPFIMRALERRFGWHLCLTAHPAAA